MLAHNVHTTDAEVERLAATVTAIAHCPMSNTGLAALFTLGGAERVREVRVEGSVVYEQR